jgi:stage II sporulation protein D
MIVPLLIAAATSDASASIGGSAGVPSLVEKRAPLRIRVRIGVGVPQFRLRGFDLHFGHSQVAGGGIRFDRLTEWTIECRGRKVMARGTPGSRSYTGGLEVDTPAGFLQYEGRPYREEIRVEPVQGGCDVINVVDLEKYLDGLVNAEFSAGWAENSIGAQVIAARTYAVHQMRQAREARAHFDVDSTVKDQVYDGSWREDWRASRAVEKTRGMILAVRDGGKVLPLKAFYHSTCGGRTELPEHVWGRPFPGFKKTVECPYCHVSPRYEWSADVVSRELAEAFLRGPGRRDWPKGWRSRLPLARLLGAQVLKMDRQGRAIDVLTRWRSTNQDLELRISAVELRNWVGTQKVRSTRFRIGPLPLGLDGLRITGRGFGHGVGMCQWGAKEMGAQGHSYASILHHYYPDATLKKLW